MLPVIGNFQKFRLLRGQYSAFNWVFNIGREIFFNLSLEIFGIFPVSKKKIKGKKKKAKGALAKRGFFFKN